jgi:hypothetical protein
MKHSDILNTLFLTIKATSSGEELDCKAYTSLSEEEWKVLYRTSVQQGLLAIVYDAVKLLPTECQPPRSLKLQWALGSETIENRFKMQHKASSLLANLWADSDIKTIVMKGLAIGTYYPIPAHRECGDLDCFLTTGTTPIESDGYELGNQLCEQIGAKVNRDYYKDATIKYRGLMVENHCFFLPIRGSRNMKALEQHLRTIALRGDTTFVPETKLIVPSADFNALFLAMHALNHFLVEGIKLRHILDWALLLKAEQNNINWEEFYQWADKMHLTRFADAMTAICVEHFGLQVTNPAIHTSSPYAERILLDTIQNSEGIHNKGYSAWKSRFMQVRNRLSFAWKYHKIYQKSLIVELTKSVFAFLFERHPKL